jgi:mlo protein
MKHLKNSKQGAYPLVSPTGMSQLHIFLFLLAVLHVFFSVSTVALARAKMKRWKAWEQETQTLDYEFSHDPARFKLTHETSFVRRHMSFWTGTPILKWIVCFFRQFCHSVTKTDYLTLRHGFIVAHFAPNSKFNFQKYIKRSLDDDFKSVVGISPPLWAFAIIFLLLNVNGWYTFFWLSFAPLAIVLLVGTKLQVIITEMALEIQDRCSVVKGTPIVRPTNDLFWFARPQLVLFLIHFTLFQTAFQIAYFFWIWYEFGLKSCFHDKFALIISKIIIEVAVQFLCSYITLPLYALVTQMGSHVKKVIFEKQIANALERWQKNATKKVKRHKKSDHSSSGFTSRSGLSFRFQSGETHGSSPLHLLHRNKTVGDINTPDISERYYHSDYDASNLEMDATPSYPPQRTESILITQAQGDTQATRQHPTSNDVDKHGEDFSFEKL